MVRWSYLKTPEDVLVLPDWLNGESLLGLDTETCWLAGQGGSDISLVQLAKPSGEALVVDALALGIDAVRDVIESPNVIKVAHNARFDQGVLKLAGLQPAAMVDTLQLARSAHLLVAPSYSLKSLTAQLFGIQLDKSYQRSNWRRRPLSEQQLAYAATDAHVTLRLFFELRRMLEDRGQWPIALHSATLRDRPNAAGPRRRRLPQYEPAPLTIEEQRAVKRLKDWRLELSRDLRVPAYMICPDRTLDHLAQRRPAAINELHEIYGLGSSKIDRFGEELLKAVYRAFETTGGDHIGASESAAHPKPTS